MYFSVKNIKKSYRCDNPQKPKLFNEQRKILSFVGESGSGERLPFKVVSGLEKLDKGLIP